jgi:hypothetical protein
MESHGPIIKEIFNIFLRRREKLSVSSLAADEVVWLMPLMHRCNIIAKRFTI